MTALRDESSDKSRDKARDERERVAAERLVAVALIMLIACSTVIMGAGILFGWVGASVTHTYTAVPARRACSVRI